MPQLQVVDLGRGNTERTAIPEFFNNLAKAYKEREDTDTISRITEEYKKNRNDINAWEDYQLALENSDISPTRRVELQKRLNESRKLLIEKDKELNQRAHYASQAEEKKEANRLKEEEIKEKAAKRAEETKTVQFILDEAGLDKDVVAKLAPTMTIKDANEYANRNAQGKKFAENREKSISDYVNNTYAQADEALEIEHAIDLAQEAINGNITGPGLEAIAKDNPYTQLFFGLTKDEATLQAANKKLLQGSTGIFGTKPTEKEVFLLLNSMLPSIGKTKEANQASLNVIKDYNRLKLKKAEITDKITEGGTKYIPNLEKMVNQELQPFKDAFRAKLEKAAKTYEPETYERIKGKEEEQLDIDARGYVHVTDPNGKPGWMPKEKFEAARKKGDSFKPIPKSK